MPPFRRMSALGANCTVEQLLTVREVSEILQVPVSWIYDHTRPGCSNPLPCLKLGKYVRFQVAAVQSYLEEMRSRNGR